MPSSAWQTSNVQWLDWIDGDANVDHPVWVSCDEFDEDLRTMLERFPFLGGLDTTSVSIVPAPLPGEQRAPDPGFDSMTTLIRQTPLPGEAEGDDDDAEHTIDTTLDAAQTMVRGRVPEDEGGLEVGIATPEDGLEIGLEPAQGGELDGLYIPNLTRTQPETPARTGDTLPPSGSATSSGTVVQPSPLQRSTDGGTVIAAGAPSGADVIAYARQYGYAPAERAPTPPYGPQVMVPAGSAYAPARGYTPETSEPSQAPEPTATRTEAYPTVPQDGAYAPDPRNGAYVEAHDGAYVPDREVYAPDAADEYPRDQEPAIPDGIDVDAELHTTQAPDSSWPDEADAGAAARAAGPPPPPPPAYGQPGPSSRGRTVESTMDTPPAIDLASARAQAYDDDDFDADEPADPRSAASSQTAGEIVTGFDAADSRHDGALADVLDEEEPPAPRKIVVVDTSAAQTAVSEEELDAADILDDAPSARLVVPVEPEPSPAEPPPRKEPPVAAKGPPPPAPKGPPPAPRASRKNDAPRGETAAALAQLAADRDGTPSLFERAPTGAWYEDAFGDHFAALSRTGHPGEAKLEIDFFIASTGLQPGASVLDVGCGEGAHAIVLAQRGYAATGFDASLPQLLRATQANEALGAGVRFLHGDMRDPPVEGPFDGILCVGTTFGYFDDDENRKVIRRLRDRLNPGGRMLLQVFNRDHVVARLPARSWWQGHGCLVLDEADMNYFTNRLQVHRTVVFEDGRQFEHDISVRAYAAHDLGSLCVDSGLRVLEISGSRLTRGRFYGATSPEIWLLVERP